MSSALRRRFSCILVLCLSVPFWHGCSDAPGPSHSLEIDFSGAPDVMVGAEVLVDGSVVGQLRPEGSRNVATFKVMAGDRTVELRKEGYESEAFKFIALESETTVLEVTMAAWLVDGEIKNALILR